MLYYLALLKKLSDTCSHLSLISKIQKSSSNNLLEDLPSPQKHRHMAGLLTPGSSYLPRLPRLGVIGLLVIRYWLNQMTAPMSLAQWLLS